MAKSPRKTDEAFIRAEAMEQGFQLRGEDGDHFSLIDGRTGQIAFEGSAEEMRNIVVQIKNFRHFGNDFGLGDTINSFDGIAIDDESWRASDLYACLIAADFKRTFHAPGNALREGFMIIARADFESWREQALAIFAPPGLFPEEEVDEYGIAIEDFFPHFNRGTRVLAKRAGQDDSEIAQGNTIIRLGDGRVLVGFGSVGTVIGFVFKYGYDAFSTKVHGLKLEVERALAARWFERKRAKPISISHPVWARLRPAALQTYKVLLHAAS
jgi:hypothetical protein